jgi:CheY-like chemotaxis protein
VACDHERMRKLRAVVADDDEDTRTLFARAGRAAGFEVDEASSAEELFGIVEQREHASDIDIVVSDISMPGVDGLEVTRRLHELMPSLPVILVSGFTHQGVLRAAVQAGARTVLAKPIDPVVLGLVMAAHCQATQLSAPRPG